jgi:uncharacterized membrane protein/uncharacterized membrane-anchored protein
MQVEHHIKTLPTAQSWAFFLEKMALLLGSTLVGSGLVCWVAANWADATVFQKLGGMQALFVLALALAYLGARRVKTTVELEFTVFAVAGGLAGVIIGALFALIGQIYQTGADAWELFLLWAVLLVPLALAVRTVALGLLLTIILNLGMALYWMLDLQHLIGWSSNSMLQAAMLMMAVNLVGLVAWEISLGHVKDPWRVGPRVCATIAMGWLAVSAFAAWNAELSIVLIVAAGLSIAGLLYAVYAHYRHDVAMTYLAGLAACGLIAFGVVSQVDSPEALLIATLVLLALAGLILRFLARQWRSTHPEQKARADGQPWFVSLFLLVVMWVGAILLAALIFWLFDLKGEDAWWAGLAGMALGLAWMRLAPDESGQHLLPASLVTAGMLMFCLGIVFREDEARWLIASGVAIVSVFAYLLAKPFVLRLLMALAALATLLVLTWPVAQGTYGLFDYLTRYDNAVGLTVALYWRIWLAVLTAVGILAAARNAAWTALGRPLAWALIVMIQLAVWFAPPPYVSMQVLDLAWQAELLLLWLACAALPLCALAAFLIPLRGLERVYRWGGPIALGLTCVGWMGAPGIAISLLWLLLGYAWSQRSLIVVGVLSLLVYLGRFYYQLDSTLIEKSWILGVTGAWLVLCGLVWHRFRPLRSVASAAPVTTEEAPADQRHQPVSTWRRILIVLTGILVLGVANIGIYQRETLLADGSAVALVLAPVDPRSIMQGDYMALRFAVADETAALLASDTDPVAIAINEQGEGYMRLVERDGYHHLDGLSVDSGHASNPSPRILLRFRLRNGQVRMPTDAWFFAEGRAGYYEQARFGEFKVDGKGRGLLKRLLNGERQPLD